LHNWTPEETRILLENYNLVSNSTLQAMIPSKSAQGIYKKAYKLGLRKSKEIEYINRSEAKSRDKSSNWKGGFRKTAKGYRQVLRPDHHRADNSGYVMEHISVFEDASGIEIPKNCCIHHLNGDKQDNRIENLCMMVTGAHTAFHHSGTHQSSESKDKMRRKRLEFYAKQNNSSRKTH